MYVYGLWFLNGFVLIVFKYFNIIFWVSKGTSKQTSQSSYRIRYFIIHEYNIHEFHKKYNGKEYLLGLKSIKKGLSHLRMQNYINMLVLPTQRNI